MVRGFLSGEHLKVRLRPPTSLRLQRHLTHCQLQSQRARRVQQAGVPAFANFTASVLTRIRCACLSAFNGVHAKIRHAQARSRAGLDVGAMLDAFELSSLRAVLKSYCLVQNTLYVLHDVAGTAGCDAGCARSSLDRSDRLSNWEDHLLCELHCLQLRPSPVQLQEIHFPEQEEPPC